MEDLLCRFGVSVLGLVGWRFICLCCGLGCSFFAFFEAEVAFSGIEIREVDFHISQDVENLECGEARSESFHIDESVSNDIEVAFCIGWCEAFLEDFRSFSVAVAWRAISFEQEFADIGIGIWVAFAIDGIACCQGTELRTLRHGLA